MVFSRVFQLLVLSFLFLIGLSAQGAKREFLQFPAGFQWCVSTSAHQIEGYNENSDWWDWEQTPGHIKNGEKSGPACDHWNRLEEDAELVRKLHVTKYRFSIEWAKIEPKEGSWDLEALEHYRREVRILRSKGIDPFITLHHFTLPRWVAKKGGFEWDGFPQAFARYAKFIVGELAREGVRDWVTLNEPMVVLSAAYLDGTFPPGRKELNYSFLNPLRGLLAAHAAAYHAMKCAAGTQPIRVGIAHHLRVFDANNRLNPVSQTLALLLNEAFNWAFMMAPETGRIFFNPPFFQPILIEVPGLRSTQDFIGVNYYSRDMVSLDTKENGYLKRRPKKGAPVTDLNWEIYPEGFYRILKAVDRRIPNKPVIITENGLADAKDSMRSEFIQDHLEELHRAISEGVNVEGYCHWSLMDNFEWLDGFTPRFGLYEVDYKTFRRTPRPSARLYSDIAKQNGFWTER